MWVLWLGLAVGPAAALAQDSPEPTPAEDAAATEDDDATQDEAPPAEGAPSPDRPLTTEDDPLARFRTPFPVLAERVIGTASAPIEYDWRKSRVQVGVVGRQLVELNNFDSLAAGVHVRVPTNGLMVEAALDRVWVADTPSSEQLAFTPFRQPGRPSRFSLDVSLGWPLAEGVVTTAPRWMPALQLVFVGTVGLRYSIYPTAMQGLTLRERIGATFAAGLREEELANLEDSRLDAMQVDPARYTPTVGIGNDIYLAQGVYVSPRATLAVPLLAAAVESELLWWGDITVAVGVAF